MAPNAKRYVASKPLARNLSMPIKDALEMLIKIFHGNGPELMKDASHFDSIAGVRIASIVRGH